MSQKIPCEVVRDLLPSYIDELTSEVTNRIVKDHLERCEECRKIYSAMTGSLTGEEEKFREQGEIDFLRKNRRRKARFFARPGQRCQPSITSSSIMAAKPSTMPMVEK